MKIFRLIRHWEAGFATGSQECGLFSSYEKAMKEAKRLEPRKVVRDFEYHAYEEEIK